MKKPRTLEILSLMYWAGATFLRGDKLKFIQGSAKLEQLGGLYVKFLQLIVINLDPDNQRNYQDMLEVYEHSPADKIDIWRYLQTELPKHKLAQFSKLARAPFATGSFGQVYYGELISGETVVIKVLRPSVQRYLRHDLRLLSFLSLVYKLIDRQSIINYRSIFKQFKRTSLEEVNYLNEVAVADYYYQTFVGHPRLVIPKTYKDLCTAKVIVQECITGLSLTKPLAVQADGQDARAYVAETLGSDLHVQLEVVGTELLGQAVLGNIMHADPHPGNIILLADNKVALIDFGMSTVLTKNRYAFYKMLVQYVGFYSGKLAIGDLALSAFRFLQRDLFEAIAQAEALIGSGNASQQPIMSKIQEAVTETFYDESNQAIVGQLLGSRSIMRILFFTINKGNRFGFSFDLEAINLIKAAQNYSVLMTTFDKEGIVGARMLQNVVDIAEAHFDQVIDSAEASIRPDPGSALEILSCWMDKVARSDPGLMEKLTAEYVQ